MGIENNELSNETDRSVLKRLVDLLRGYVLLVTGKDEAYLPSQPDMPIPPSRTGVTDIAELRERRNATQKPPDPDSPYAA